jgi:hypothetical protein
MQWQAGRKGDESTNGRTCRQVGRLAGKDNESGRQVQALRLGKSGRQGQANSQEQAGKGRQASTGK